MHLSVEPSPSWPRMFAAAALTVVALVVAETVVLKISSHAPRLAYASPESLPFNGGGKNVGVYQVEISNEGDSAAEDITGTVRIPGATVDNQRVSGPAALQVDAKTEGDTVRLAAPSLNPTETIDLSVLASAPTALPTTPEVSVRAKGLSALRKERGTPMRAALSIPWTALVASAAVLVMLLLQFMLRKGGAGRGPSSAPASSPALGGWKKAANVFWLGHDLLWSKSAASSWGNRERILHGLRQSKHHASEVGLSDTDAYRRLESVDLAVRKMGDADLTAQSRPGLAAQIEQSLYAFGKLAGESQPGFKPGP
jgi:hypothetical protein